MTDRASAEGPDDPDIIAALRASGFDREADAWARRFRSSESDGRASAEPEPDRADLQTVETPDDVERLARGMHLARLLPDMDEPYCDNPLTEADLAKHMRWAEAILHAVSMLPPYARSTPRTETSDE